MLTPVPTPGWLLQWSAALRSPGPGPHRCHLCQPDALQCPTGRLQRGGPAGSAQGTPCGDTAFRHCVTQGHPSRKVEVTGAHGGLRIVMGGGRGGRTHVLSHWHCAAAKVTLWRRQLRSCTPSSPLGDPGAPLAGGGVSEEGRRAGGEDRSGAARLHQPQGGEADGDDGGVRRHALWRAAADGEASQGD